MSDERAVQLANLIAEYYRASVKEGATEDEVDDWTLRETLADIVQTTPPYLMPQLDTLAKERGLHV